MSANISEGSGVLDVFGTSVGTPFTAGAGPVLNAGGGGAPAIGTADGWVEP